LNNPIRIYYFALMIIQIENKDYKLIPTEEEGIRIDDKNKEIPTIYAAARYSINELATYIQQYSKNRKLKTNPDEDFIEFFTINLFDKKYPARAFQSGNSRPYLKNDIIYYSKNNVSRINHEKLIAYISDSIFEQCILDFVSFWEEEFNLLIQDITFKKMSSSLYLVKQGSIIYNKSNRLFNRRVNEYLVAKALLEIAGQNKIYTSKFSQYFLDLKQIEKLISYGK